jgi:hypothetical protein
VLEEATYIATHISKQRQAHDFMETYKLIIERANTITSLLNLIGESTATTKDSGLQFEEVSRGKRTASLEGRKEDEDDTT